MLRQCSRDRKYELGYTDEELETIIIRLNNDAMYDLQIGNLKKVFTELTEASAMLERIERSPATKQKLRAFTLNGWACYHHQKKQNVDALKLIDEAIALELEGVKDNLSLARSYLNKCVILSQLSQHDEALKFAHKAIESLEVEKRLVGANRKRRQKLSELFVISFYNIAAEFEFMAQTESAMDAYRKGYDICKELLGQSHRLSQLMRKNLRNTKNRNERVSTIHEMEAVNESDPSYHVDGRQHRRRIKTIEVQLYSSEIQRKRSSIKKHDVMSRSDKHETAFGGDSRILEKPENYLHMKNIKERLSRTGHRNNSEEEEDSLVVDRLKRIYMPESYRKAKLRSRMNPKSMKTEVSPRANRKRHTVEDITKQSKHRSNQKSSQKGSIHTGGVGVSREFTSTMVPEGSARSRPTVEDISKQSPKEIHHFPTIDPPRRQSIELPTIATGKANDSTKECRVI